MGVAIAAAQRAEGRSAPNPPVGCAIIDKQGRLVAVGHTARGGRPHAETTALAMAGDAARGGCAYVTLEPCAHVGQTPPCAEALIAAGIARVVVAMRDPDPRVDGRGVDLLTKAGIVVRGDVGADAASRVMAGFLHRTKQARPFVTLKTATSLDGKIALGDGAKRWITGPRMRRFVHLQRSRCDAILTAIGTVLADDPALTCRLDGADGDHPARFVMDSQLRTPLDSQLLASLSDARVTIFCARDTDSGRAEALRAAGADLQPVSLDDKGKLSLDAVMAAIAAAGYGHVLIEAGGKLASSLLRANLVDSILWTSSAQIIGNDGIPSVAELDLASLPENKRFQMVEEGHFGTDRFILMDRIVGSR